jgi:hypothetical protein
MNEQKIQEKSIAFLEFAVKSGLLNSDLTYEEIYDCYTRKDEEFQSVISELNEED